MSQPSVDVDLVSQGVIGVLTAILAAQRTLGDHVVAFFLDRVPERGSKLWERFLAFERGKKDVGFLDFILSVNKENPLKLFFPRECLFSELTQQILLEPLQEALKKTGASSDEEIFQVYFGEGPVYEALRAVSCKGCGMSQCQHNLGSRIASRR